MHTLKIPLKILFTAVCILRELPVLSSIFIRKSGQLHTTESSMRLQVRTSKGPVPFLVLVRKVLRDKFRKRKSTTCVPNTSAVLPINVALLYKF